MVVLLEWKAPMPLRSLRLSLLLALLIPAALNCAKYDFDDRREAENPSGLATAADNRHALRRRRRQPGQRLHRPIPRLPSFSK